ncbi:hypothetical protein [Mycobacterium sp. OTB74]|uniref:hypothetical protein n=1 Tax=Mycobacterium sp. OTB74 TaxID=1853452 RepID=UPI002476D813|nr:hypothetical protein [Mycobacterium sp. OTB74]
MAVVRELIGVYNGDGGIRGELAYVLGKLRGTTECALCDITHRGIRSNPQWKDVVCELAVPFDLVHRNERTAEVAQLTGDDTPAVVAVTDEGLRLVMRAADFAGAGTDAAAFVQVLRERVAEEGLRWA